MPPPLSSHDGDAAPRFRVGDLEVDVGKAEVLRGDERITLPKLSFDLLLALIRAAPSIVTNEDLLQQVWPGLMVSPESVSQRVKLLRDALGDDSQQPRYILGVRGRGYRLIPVPERLTESQARPSISDAINPSVNAPSPTTAETVVQAAPTLPDAPTPRAAGVGRRVGLVAAVLIALGAALALGLRFWPGIRSGSPQSEVAIADKSIAVLPFVDLSEKKDQEYFGDGMAEEIIDLLMKVPGLKVIGRTSSFQFKGKTEDLRSIGKQLGVTWVVEGSVRKSGDRLRVTAQLINAQDGANLWSQTYDRDLGDVLKMQDDIAIKVAHSIGLEVAITNAVSRPSLRNKEAYALYLRALHRADRYDRPGWERTVSELRRALELDPSFAEAAESLAAWYIFGAQFGYVTPSEAFEQSQHFAELTLKLDPTNAGAHLSRGLNHMTYDWDWAAADRELKQALALAPNATQIWVTAAQLNLTMGHVDEALKQIEAVVNAEPLDATSYFWLNIVQLRRGRLQEAEAAIRHGLEITPTFGFGQFQLGLVLLARGQPEAALAEFLKEPQEDARLNGSAMAYFALRRRAESDAALAESIKRNVLLPSAIAAVYAYRRENDEAFKWLDRAYAQRDFLLFRIKYSVEFDNLHDDPRYKAFLKKMNLPE
jgi:TolB-like protein/DNA-binding winged helix-turn-helix (wHTH) protein/Tfp pilus assembly protein PilF